MPNPSNRPQAAHTLRIIAVSLVLLVIVQVLVNLDTLSGLLKALTGMGESVLYGFVFAYLLNPFVRLVDRFLFPMLKKRMKKERSAWVLSRVTGIVFAFAMGVLIVWLLLVLILPQLGESLIRLVNSLPGYYRSVEAWVLRLLDEYPQILVYADQILQRTYDFLADFLRNGIDSLLSSLQNIVVGVTSSAVAIITGLVNMVIGLIIAVYVLYSKDQFRAQSKKLLVAMCRPETADRWMEYGRQVDQIFNSFIIGKLIDSLIVGVLCYIGTTVMGAPYGVLIATIIGITNLIPYFGPIIGTVPCAVLILLDDPMTCVYFVIFILVLQQIDGNIISPRIMSGTVGVSGFWVLVSLAIGGGLFGIVGMLLSVPVFAVIYLLLADRVNRTLRRKGRSTVTDEYLSIRSTADLDRAAADGVRAETPETAEPPAGPDGEKGA